jgi:hypothetical protein
VFASLLTDQLHQMDQSQTAFNLSSHTSAPPHSSSVLSLRAADSHINYIVLQQHRCCWCQLQHLHIQPQGKT